eukprot:2446824-Rhodomonas_salina.1
MQERPLVSQAWVKPNLKPSRQQNVHWQSRCAARPGPARRTPGSGRGRARLRINVKRSQWSRSRARYNSTRS